MSRTTILLIMFMFTLSGVIMASDVRSQNISKIRLTGIPTGKSIREVLVDLEKQTGFSFVYLETVGSLKIDSLSSANSTLKQVLQEIAAKNHLYIYQRDRMIALVEIQDKKEPGTLSGRITDRAGLPLQGVSVTVFPTKQTVATDAQGMYTLRLSAGTYTIEISHLSHGKQTKDGIEIGEGQNITSDFTMEQALSQLNEVVVVGYGKQQKGDLTGSIAALPENKLPETRVESPDKMLKGRIAGVYVAQNSGQPGSTTTMRIRGGTSINAGNDPLVIVDGIPMDISSQLSSSGVIQGGSINPLASINSADIKSISVLKDASATAIYGSRGANGVIIITTKSGAEGVAKIDFNSSFGIQQLRKKIPLLNATEYAQIRNEASVNYGQPPVYTPEQIAGFGKGTDWQDEVFRSALMQNYGLSVSGGNAKTQYYLSGGFTKQEGIIIHSDLTNFNTRLNLTTAVSDNLKFGINLTLNKIKSNIIRSSTGTSGSDAGIVNGVLMMDPTLSIYKADGTYVLRSDNDTPNPVATAKEVTNGVNTNRAIGNIFGEYRIGKQLTLRSSIGFNYLNNNELFFKPNTVFIGGSEINAAAVGSVSKEHWIFGNTATYQPSVLNKGKHAVDLLGGFTLEGDRLQLLRAGASNFPNNQLRENNLSSGTVFPAPQTHVETWRLVSYLARANYTLNNKYIFTASARYDGSSRFGAGEKYGFFPSAAAAWRLSREGFIKSLNFFDDLKLRTSYGVTGNQEIGNYQSLSLLGVVSVVAGDMSQVGVYPQNIGNPALKWETTNQFDIGLDASFWKKRMHITVDYYRKNTKDLLLNVPVAWTTGFDQALVNLGELRNEGIELSVGMDLIRKADFDLGLELNFAKNKNTILNLGTTGQFFVGQSEIVIREGLPLGSFFGLQYDGIFQNQGEIDKSAQKNAKPGDVRYVDFNGDQLINASDRSVIGSAQPDFTGGGSLRVRYKSVELSTFFNYVIGNEIYNKDRIDLDMPTGLKNHSRRVLDRWTATSPSTTMQRANRGAQYQFSDMFLEDGSYFRVQDITLTFNLSNRLLNKTFFRNARLNLTAENLITVTNYTGFDPEVSLYGQSALSQGIDQGVYPTAKTYRLGLQLGF